VIGLALAAKAAGAGRRLIAAGLGRAAETVRGWLRRFAGRVEAVRAVFTRWCRALAPDPVLPGPAQRLGGRPRGDHRCGGGGRGPVRARLGACWEVASAVSAGRLLSPGWPSETRAG
jgi:hypothetical protein